MNPTFSQETIAVLKYTTSHANARFSSMVLVATGYKFEGTTDSRKQTRRSNKRRLCEAMPVLPPQSFPKHHHSLPFISKIQRLESLMCKSKTKEIPGALLSVLMNVLKRNVIREVIDLSRRLCSRFMFYGFWGSGGWAVTVLF